MGLAEWLSNARLAYHGYTPEVIEARRRFLQQREAERKAREFADSERLRLAQESGARAVEDQEAQRQKAKDDAKKTLVDSVREQLRRGAKEPLGYEGLTVGEFKAIQQSVEDERSFAEQQEKLKAEREKTRRDIEEVEAEARQLRIHQRSRDYDLAHPVPDKPEKEREPKVNPFLDRAYDEADTLQPPDTMTTAVIAGKSVLVADPEKRRQWALKRARQLQEESASLKDQGPAAASGSIVLTAAEQQAITRLDPESRSEFEALLASGNTSAITAARKRLAQRR